MKPSTRRACVTLPLASLFYGFIVWASGWEPARGYTAVFVLMEGALFMLGVWAFGSVGLSGADIDYERERKA